MLGVCPKECPSSKIIRKYRQSVGGKNEREMESAKLKGRILLVLSRKHMFIWKRFWLDRLFV